MQKKKKPKKKNKKLLIQMGRLIILLFTVVILLSSNMLILTAFSTALRFIALTREKSLQDEFEYLEDYEFLPWLPAYWAEHGSEMYTLPDDESGQDEFVAENERVRRILAEHVHKESVYELTAEDLQALPDEELGACALLLYHLLNKQSFLSYCKKYDSENLELLYLDEEEGCFYTLFTAENRENGGFHPTRSFSTADMEAEKKALAQDLKGDSYFGLQLPYQRKAYGLYVQCGQSDALNHLYFRTEIRSREVFQSMRQVQGIVLHEIILLAAAACAILGSFFMFVIKPLSGIKKIVKEYQISKDAGKACADLADIHSENELGILADEFSALASEMERYTREKAALAAEKEHTAVEMKVASDIQTDLLPRDLPDSSSFRLFASMHPAKEVGGDFYDYYFIDGDHLVLTIADVSGKGVPAALFMVYSKTILKNRVFRGGTPGEILRDANEALNRDHAASMFATVWLGIVTLSTGELIYANAGHEDPFIRTGRGSFRIRRSEHGTALGMLPDSEYEDITIRLSEGDALFVFTDGVTEAESPDGSLFGENRLNLVLKSTGSDSNPEAVVSAVLSAVREFAGDASQYDDITMLSFIYTGK